MKLFKKMTLVFITLFFCVGCDQVTKIGALRYLEGNAPVSFLGDLFWYQFAENRGAMYGMGDTLPEEVRFLALVVGVSVFLVAALVYVLIQPLHSISVIGISLFIGGGMGNLWDRIFNAGAVIDFMVIQIGPLKTGIFNVADVVILVGTALLLVSFTFLEGDSSIGSDP